MLTHLLTLLLITLTHTHLHATEVIMTPGEYVIGTNLEYDPAPTETAIIVIASDNVVLNLNQHTLSQKTTSTIANIDIITVNPNIVNFTIKNGSVKNASGYGIRIGDGSKTINMLDLNVIHCSKGGIFFDGSPTGTGISNGYLLNCIAIESTGTYGGSAYGLRMVNANHIEARECNFDYNDSGTNAPGYGIYMNSCQRCEFVETQANDNAGSTFGAGVYLYNSHYCVFKDFIAQNNTARDTSGTATAAGIFFESSQANLVRLAKSSSNICLTGYAYGMIANNGASTAFHDCLAGGNKGNIIAAGFALINSSYSTVALTSSRLNNGQAGTGYGIYLSGSSYCDIRENRIMANVGISGVGLKDTVSNTTNLITNNLSYLNTTTGYQVTRTDGGNFPVLFGSVGNFTNFDAKSSLYNYSV